MDAPAYVQPPKSTRFKPGGMYTFLISSRNHFVAELVTDMAELKKMYKDIDEVGKGYGVN